ncbi:Phage head completion protein (GPL) [Escherichia coli]|nr:Phage head completion protein (GPL) [Escherichia coli]
MRWRPRRFMNVIRGVDASAKGDKKADSIDSTIDELWRDMRWAVARIQDKPRCIVSQI